MENLYFKEEDKDKVFIACTYQGTEVKGELFHVNGNHFILVDGSVAVKVVPQTVKVFNPTEEQTTVSDDARKASEEAKDKLVGDTYQKVIDEIKSRASQGYTSVVTQIPNIVASSLTELLSNEGFVSRCRITSDDSYTLYVNW